jgi:hypothetical protein
MDEFSNTHRALAFSLPEQTEYRSCLRCLPTGSRLARNEAASQRRQFDRHACGHGCRIYRRISFRAGALRRAATPRAHSSAHRRNSRMRGDTDDSGQLRTHTFRCDHDHSASSAACLSILPARLSTRQRASRILSSRTRAAGDLLTIGVPPLRTAARTRSAGG